MCAVGAWRGQKRLREIDRPLDRPAGFPIQPRSPGDAAHESAAREKFPCGAVQHVKEAVLIGLRDHLARPAADRQIGLDQRFGGVVVPIVAGRRLKMPGQLAGGGMHREDRIGVPIVSAAALRAIPGRRVAGAEIEQVELAVIDKALPRRPSAAALPPPPAPGLSRLRQCRRFEAFRGIAGHGVAAPQQPAALRIVGGNGAAHPVLRAAAAYHHSAAGDLWRAGDAVWLRSVGRGHFPRRLAGTPVERDQAGVERAHIDFLAVERDSTIHGVAAQEGGPFARHLRIESPQGIAGPRVEGVDHAPTSGGVNHTAVRHRRGFKPARGIQFAAPCQTQARHVAGVDLRQRTKPAGVIPIGAAWMNGATRAQNQQRRRCQAQPRCFRHELPRNIHHKHLPSGKCAARLPSGEVFDRVEIWNADRCASQG